MIKQLESYSLVIIGAGITGLSVAREFKQRYPNETVLILEKESNAGKHGSGRNSGVLHSGIYYPKGSLKAQVCSSGAKKLKEYCIENNISLNQMGKVVVPTEIEQDELLEELKSRADFNGAEATIVSQNELNELEPYACSATGRALWVPQTTVVNPIEVLDVLIKELITLGVKFSWNSFIVSVDTENKQIQNNEGVHIHYQYLVNAAGQFADRVAKLFDVGLQYEALPFKGLYYKLKQNSGISLKRLVYPVPDLNMPFLGIHSVNDLQGNTYFGPTAVPALGRANYKALENIEVQESIRIGYRLLGLVINDTQGFREYSKAEGLRFFKSNFAKAASKIVKGITADKLQSSNKVGIRAQLYNKDTKSIEMDFILDSRLDTHHVLNAISPAFTSSFSLAKLIVNKIKGN